MATLKEWRAANGLTQSDAGSLIGVSFVTISHWESKKPPTIRGSQILKILDVTKGEVTANDLYGITNEQIKHLAKR